MYVIIKYKNIQNIKNWLRPAPPGGGGVWCDTPAVKMEPPLGAAEPVSPEIPTSVFVISLQSLKCARDSGGNHFEAQPRHFEGEGELICWGCGVRESLRTHTRSLADRQSILGKRSWIHYSCTHWVSWREESSVAR